jgi:hypothetical protein
LLCRRTMRPHRRANRRMRGAHVGMQNREATWSRQWPCKAAGWAASSTATAGPRNRRTSQRAAAGAQALGRSQWRLCDVRRTQAGE